MWTLDSADPNRRLSEERVRERVESKLRDVSIFLLHANGKGRHTQAVVRTLVGEYLPQHQFRPLTVSQLLACHAP
jgi:hypothetical protein